MNLAMCDSGKASCVMDCHLFNQTFILKTAYTGESLGPPPMDIHVSLKLQELFL